MQKPNPCFISYVFFGNGHLKIKVNKAIFAKLHTHFHNKLIAIA